MRTLRNLLKRLGIVALLLAYILTSFALIPLPAGARLRRLFLTRNTSLYSRLMLSLLNIRVRVKHRERAEPARRGRLVVSNHVSYLDILVISSVMPSVFITSVELGGTLFLGLLAKLGGSLFVERRSASGLKREIAAITRVLGEGFSVALFPEGTTSNGERVRPFKNALFDAAVTAGADILPLCVRYIRVNGRDLTPENRDLVFYHGGASFFRHAPRLAGLQSVDVEVLPLKLIRTGETESRKELAVRAHEAVSKAYHG
jgi:1-acyl-sn-glycerol-3-phosphate acyltransferase